MTPARILVVDDEENIGGMLTRTLRRAGYHVTTATDGVDAIEKIVAQTPDLILLDVIMPRMNGVETLQRIRATPEIAHVPVIMLTTKSQLADKMAAFERGADDYLAKPFELTEVIARVRSVLKRTEQTRLAIPLMGLLGTWSSAEGLAQFGRDLEAARDIQLRLLPPVPPVLGDLDAGAVLIPSTVVSGDFYDLVPMRDYIGVAVGDVSGKGIPAALFMAMVRTLLREIARDAAAPAEVLSRLNASLCRDMPPSMFVTMVLLLIDPGRPGHLVIANGGHPEPVLVTADGQPRRLEVGGTVLGAFPEGSFEQIDQTLEPGQTLVLFSDGVLEVADEHGHRRGLPGLLEVLTASRQRPPPEMARAVADHVVSIAGPRMRDDVTVFVLRR